MSQKARTERGGVEKKKKVTTLLMEVMFSQATDFANCPNMLLNICLLIILSSFFNIIIFSYLHHIIYYKTNSTMLHYITSFCTKVNSVNQLTLINK